METKSGINVTVLKHNFCDINSGVTSEQILCCLTTYLGNKIWKPFIIQENTAAVLKPFIDQSFPDTRQVVKKSFLFFIGRNYLLLGRNNRSLHSVRTTEKSIRIIKSFGNLLCVGQKCTINKVSTTCRLLLL